LLIITGCRRGEIAGLKWSKVDFKKKILTIDNNLLSTHDKNKPTIEGTRVYEDTTKGKQARHIKISNETVAVLKEWEMHQKEMKTSAGSHWKELDFVFTREDGLPICPGSVNIFLRKFSERYNLPHIKPHKLRHTLASNLINQGVDIVTVSNRLGHAQTSTTLNVYSHVVNKADEKLAEQAADMFLRKKD